MSEIYSAICIVQSTNTQTSISNITGLFLKNLGLYDSIIDWFCGCGWFWFCGWFCCGGDIFSVSF